MSIDKFDVNERQTSYGKLGNGQTARQDSYDEAGDSLTIVTPEGSLASDSGAKKCDTKIKDQVQRQKVNKPDALSHGKQRSLAKSATPPKKGASNLANGSSSCMSSVSDKSQQTTRKEKHQQKQQKPQRAVITPNFSSVNLPQSSSIAHQSPALQQTHQNFIISAPSGALSSFPYGLLAHHLGQAIILNSSAQPFTVLPVAAAASHQQNQSIINNNNNSNNSNNNSQHQQSISTGLGVSSADSAQRQQRSPVGSSQPRPSLQPLFFTCRMPPVAGPTNGFGPQCFNPLVSYAQLAAAQQSANAYAAAAFGAALHQTGTGGNGSGANGQPQSLVLPSAATTSGQQMLLRTPQGIIAVAIPSSFGSPRPTLLSAQQQASPSRHPVSHPDPSQPASFLKNDYQNMQQSTPEKVPSSSNQQKHDQKGQRLSSDQQKSSLSITNMSSSIFPPPPVLTLADIPNLTSAVGSALPITMAATQPVHLSHHPVKKETPPKKQHDSKKSPTKTSSSESLQQRCSKISKTNTINNSNVSNSKTPPPTKKRQLSATSLFGPKLNGKRRCSLEQMMQQPFSKIDYSNLSVLREIHEIFLEKMEADCLALMDAPRVLTHYVDGFVIQESVEPFPISPTIFDELPLFDWSAPPRLTPEKSTSTTLNDENQLDDDDDFDEQENNDNLIHNIVVNRNGSIDSVSPPNLCHRLDSDPPPIDEPHASVDAKCYRSPVLSLLEPPFSSEDISSCQSSSLPKTPNLDQCPSTSSRDPSRTVVTVVETSPSIVDVPAVAAIRLNSADKNFNEQNWHKKMVSDWTVEDVQNWLHAKDYGAYAETFRQQEIDGQALLLLHENHLTHQMAIKVGPALKILAALNKLRV